MNESGPEHKRQLPGREMLNERFSWLLKYGQQVGVRLLAQAASENGYSDAIDFLYEEQTRLAFAATVV